MAAMNTAYALSGRGRHVLLVDMDLEAPGISGFLERTGELDGKASGSSLDILALLEEALVVANNNGPATLPKASEKLPGIATYARSVLLNKLMKPKVGMSGRLDVLGIAKDSHGRLANLGLADLNHEKLVALSSVLFYYFKAQRFPFRPLGVEDFEPPVETPYDYVLVDSRTGLTEIGGLCVGPLADRLVVLTGLNDQNVQGTADFLEMVGIKPRTAETGRWDEADPGEKDSVPSLGPKPTILVASPVPAGEMDYRRKRLDELEKRLGIRPVTLSYHPQMALMETVMVRDYPDEYLGREYIVLTNRLMEQVLDDGEA